MRHHQKFNADHFPTRALGTRLSHVVEHISAKLAANESVVAAAVLSQISLVCQGVIDVETRPGLISPTSLFYFLIQGSGERKTAIANTSSIGVRSFSLDAAKQHQAAMSKFKTDLEAWNAEGRGIQAAIRKKSEAGDYLSNDLGRLEAYRTRKPIPPKSFKLIHENTTMTALIRSLESHHPTTALLSDEALVVLSGRGLSEPGLLNKIFDGSPIIFDRVVHGETVIERPVLTISLAMQPGVFHSLIDRSGSLLRDSGLLARCFLIEPPAMAGFRFIDEDQPTEFEYEDWFHDRCIKILNSHIVGDNGELAPRRTLTLSPSALERWNAEFNAIEFEMQTGGLFFHFKDFGSKHANKIARISALLHFFDELEGPIQLDTMERAITIATWLAHEFTRVMVPYIPIRQDLADAYKIRDWLVRRYAQSPHERAVRKNDILQLGPNPVRSKSALNAALGNLLYWNDVVEWRDPQSNKMFVELTDQCIQSHLRHLR